MRALMIGIGAGSIGGFSQDAYDALSWGRLVAPAKKDGTPRPVGIGGVFRRGGARALLAASKSDLRSFYQKRGQQACGTRGAAEKLAAMRRLRLQMGDKSGLARVLGVCDERNGFNCLRRDSILTGLTRLPPQLQWLKQTFVRFYRGVSKLRYGSDGNGDMMADCSRGCHQGDPCSMLYFSAGMDAALMKLRAEFPDANIQAYADDVVFDVAGGSRTPVTADLQPLGGAPDDGTPMPEDMPTAAAIIQRWKQLALEVGLEVRIDKCHVTSLDGKGTLKQEEYGLVDVCEGLLMMGIPMGSAAWEADTCNEIAGKVASVYTNARNVETKQSAQLLSVYCGGVACINHLLRSTDTATNQRACITVDRATNDALCTQFGVNRLSPAQANQCALPIRHGGLGYRRSTETADEAMLGGFACAAHLGYGIGEMDARLLKITEKPDDYTNLPMIASLKDAWQRVITGNKHLRAMAKAAAVGHEIFTGADDAKADDPIPDAEARYENLWKKDFIIGGVPADQAYGSVAFDDELLDDVDDAIASGNLSQDQIDMATNPEHHISIIKLLSDTPWIQQHWPMQKLIGRSMSRGRFRDFWRALPTLDEQLRIRAMLNPLAGRPFRVLPNTPLNKLNDEQLIWIVLDRLGMNHPETTGLTKCTCTREPRLKTGRHCKRCQVGGGVIIVHDATRDVMASCIRNAGVSVIVEARAILPGSNEAPADVLAVGIGSQHRDVAIDVAIVDSQEVNDNADAERFALMTGAAARRYHAWKLHRRQEPGGRTMEERLKHNGYDCLPMVFEVDGATDGKFATFIKKLSEIAFIRRGHDQKYFADRWTTAIAMTIAKRSAQVGIRRAQTLQNRSNGTPTQLDDYGDGPLGPFGVEAPHHLGATESASPIFADGGFY